MDKVAKVFVEVNGKTVFNTNVPDGFNYCTGKVEKIIYLNQALQSSIVKPSGKINGSSTI